MPERERAVSAMAFNVEWDILYITFDLMADQRLRGYVAQEMEGN